MSAEPNSQAAAGRGTEVSVMSSTKARAPVRGAPGSVIVSVSRFLPDKVDAVRVSQPPSGATLRDSLPIDFPPRIPSTTIAIAKAEPTLRPKSDSNWNGVPEAEVIVSSPPGNVVGSIAFVLRQKLKSPPMIHPGSPRSGKEGLPVLMLVLATLVLTPLKTKSPIVLGDEKVSPKRADVSKSMVTVSACAADASRARAAMATAAERRAEWRRCCSVMAVFLAVALTGKKGARLNSSQRR